MRPFVTVFSNKGASVFWIRLLVVCSLAFAVGLFLGRL
jgi:hypothetical protein